jgi:hypothetical protein
VVQHHLTTTLLGNQVLDLVPVVPVVVTVLHQPALVVLELTVCSSLQSITFKIWQH